MIQKLSVKWSKRERDLVIDYPAKRDGHWISDQFRDLIEGLKSRGYDITTMKFSVEKSPPVQQPTEDRDPRDNDLWHDQWESHEFGARG